MQTGLCHLMLIHRLVLFTLLMREQELQKNILVQQVMWVTHNAALSAKLLITPIKRFLWCEGNFYM